MNPTDAPIEDEEGVVKASEMYHGRTGSIPRVDAVKGPASGMKFIVLKAGAEQDPEAIAAVQKAATTGLPPTLQEAPMDAVTVEASAPPAPDPELKVVAKKRNRPGSPVSLEELAARTDALAAPVAKSDDAPEVPAEPVAKADGEDLDASTVVADGPSGGNPGSPGSPGWEGTDAATAQKWTSILSRAKLALSYMAGREAQEAANGDSDGADNAWNLEDACAAIDFAITTLAGYAAGEEAEADLAQAGGVVKAQDAEWHAAMVKGRQGMPGGMAPGHLNAAGAEEFVRKMNELGAANRDTANAEAVAKAMTGFPVKALETVEALTAVRKAGRVLSSSNEQLIRDATSKLETVLSSLPAAPEVVEKSQEEPAVEPVGKANDPMVAVFDLARQPAGYTTQSRLMDFDRLRTVRKASDTPMVACYNSNGDLIGVVDPDDLISTAAGKPAEEADAEADPNAAPDAAPAADAAQAAAAAPAAAAPAAAAPVAKAQDTPETPTAEPTVDEIVATAVQKAMTTVQEDHERVVKELTDRVSHMEQQPDNRHAPLLNGMANSASGQFTRTNSGALVLRGQEGTTEPEGVTAVLKALAAETDPLKQIELQKKAAVEMYKAQQGLNG